MERLKVNPYRPPMRVVARAARLIARGGVVAYPTETYYGIGANAFDSAASRRIMELKGRGGDKALPLIVADLEQIGLLTDRLPPSVGPLAEAFWPGPLTLVIPIRSGIGGALENRTTAAVRVSGLPLASELARVAACPITATSANPADQPPARRAEDVEALLGGGLDLLLDGGPTPGGKPSTIVDVTGTEPRLLREGPISIEDVWKVLLGA